MKQCRMQKGTKCRVGWIPSKFAVKGRLIDLKLDGRWSKGWTVIMVHKVELSETYLEAHESDHKKQRKASDI